MRLVTFRTTTKRGLRPGALLPSGDQVIDLGHALGHAVPRGRHWFDLDGEFLPAAIHLFAALQADPGSEMLNRILVSNMQKKLDLLRSTAAAVRCETESSGETTASSTLTILVSSTR